MIEGPPTRVDVATAGRSPIAAMIGGAVPGFGLGSLAGLAVPLGLAGLLAGLVAGLALVNARSRRL